MNIYFYATHGRFGCFSNFSIHGFFLDGYYWKTVEHYFQAQKFLGTHYADIIRQTSKPRDAAKLGRTRKYKLRDNWDYIKNDIMYKGVFEKFKTNENIQKILIGTENAKLIENSPYDYYWGCGQEGSGKNHLGEILMKVRMILNKNF